MSTTKHKPILIIGSINIDIYLHINHLPTTGQTIRTTHQTVNTRLGGKSTNTAIAAVRASQHSDVMLIGCIGDDIHSQQVLTELQQHSTDKHNTAHLDIKHVTKHAGQSTGQAYILHQSDGDNSIILVNGANYTGWSSPDNDTEQHQHKLTPAIRSEIAALIPTCQCILLSCEVPLWVNIAVAHMAHSAGVPVMLDMGGNSERVYESNDLCVLLALVDVIVPNETELQLMASDSGDGDQQNDIDALDDDAVMKMCERVQLKLCGLNILVTLGAQGSLYRSSTRETVRVHATSAKGSVKVVDTTGGGDCFRGCYAVARYCEGLSVEDSMRFATSAAELSIQSIGASNSMPYREQIDDRLENT